jgi:hypothetical protein
LNDFMLSFLLYGSINLLTDCLVSHDIYVFARPLRCSICSGPPHSNAPVIGNHNRRSLPALDDHFPAAQTQDPVHADVQCWLVASVCLLFCVFTDSHVSCKVAGIVVCLFARLLVPFAFAAVGRHQALKQSVNIIGVFLSSGAGLRPCRSAVPATLRRSDAQPTPVPLNFAGTRLI